jgi:hypothetical protein
MTKKANPSLLEVGALIGVVTTSLIKLVPVIDAHPVGGSILAACIVITSLCWVMARKE